MGRTLMFSFFPGNFPISAGDAFFFFFLNHKLCLTLSSLWGKKTNEMSERLRDAWQKCCVCITIQSVTKKSAVRVTGKPKLWLRKHFLGNLQGLFLQLVFPSQFLGVPSCAMVIWSVLNATMITFYSLRKLIKLFKLSVKCVYLWW